MLAFLKSVWNWFFCMHTHTKIVKYYIQNEYTIEVYEAKICAKCGDICYTWLGKYSLVYNESAVKQLLASRGIKSREEVNL